MRNQTSGVNVAAFIPDFPLVFMEPQNMRSSHISSSLTGTKFQRKGHAAHSGNSLLKIDVFLILFSKLRKLSRIFLSGFSVRD